MGRRPGGSTRAATARAGSDEIPSAVIGNRDQIAVHDSPGSVGRSLVFVATTPKSGPGVMAEHVSVKTQTSAFTLRSHDIRRSRRALCEAVGRCRFQVAIRRDFTAAPRYA